MYSEGDKMEQLSDERIMAYIDGELTPAETEEIRKAIQKDPNASKRAEIFKESAAMLQGVYDAPLSEAVPQRLIDTVRQHRPDRSKGRIRCFLSSLFQWPRWSPAYALSLLLALVCGVGAGYLVFHQTIPPGNLNANLLTGNRLTLALEKTPSGQTFTVADGAVEITPLATFRNKKQSYCRQYEAEKSGAQQNGLIRGIACRTPSGQWRPLVEMTVAPIDTPPENTADYVPAGQDDLFSDIVEKTMDGAPLSLDQEATLIGRSWH